MLSDVIRFKSPAPAGVVGEGRCQMTCCGAKKGEKTTQQKKAKKGR
jgi:hypothetical protein